MVIRRLQSLLHLLFIIGSYDLPLGIVRPMEKEGGKRGEGGGGRHCFPYKLIAPDIR